MNYNCILLRPSAVCRYIYCIVYLHIVQLIYRHFRHSCCYNDVVPWAHPSTQSKRRLGQSAIFLWLTIFPPYTSLCVGTCSPQKKNCPFPSGDQVPDLLHGSLGPPKSTTQIASRSVHPFLQSSHLYLTDAHR